MPYYKYKSQLPFACRIGQSYQDYRYVLCEHVKSLDLSMRNCKIVEQMPEDLLDKVIATVFSEMDKPKHVHESFETE